MSVGSQPARENRRRVRSGDVILVLLLGAVLFALFTFDFRQIFQVLYSPTAGIVLLVVIVEFLVLKSVDRTRLFRLEINRLRKWRRNDETLLRESRDILEAQPSPEDDEWEARKEKLLKDLNQRL